MDMGVLRGEVRDGMDETCERRHHIGAVGFCFWMILRACYWRLKQIRAQVLRIEIEENGMGGGIRQNYSVVE